MPAIARAAIRTFIDGAIPHSSVPEPNSDNANSNAPLRPRMSDSLPYNGVKQHTDSKYEVPMYEDWFDRLKNAPIGESNVATIVPVVTREVGTSSLEESAE